MRNTVFSFCLFLLISAPYDRAYSQPQFNGRIVYRISMEQNGSPSQSGTMVINSGNRNILIDMKLKGTGTLSTRLLYRHEEHSLFLLIDSTKTALQFMLPENSDGFVQGEVPEAYKDTYEKAIDEVKKKNESMKKQWVDRNEIKKIAGFSCRKYSANEPGNSETTNYWLTDKISFPMPGFLGSQSGILDGFFTGKGFPLGIETISGNNGTQKHMIMEAVRIDNHQPGPDTFLIPPNYQVRDLMNLLGK